MVLSKASLRLSRSTLGAKLKVSKVKTTTTTTTTAKREVTEAIMVKERVIEVTRVSKDTKLEKVKVVASIYLIHVTT